MLKTKKKVDSNNQPALTHNLSRQQKHEKKSAQCFNTLLTIQQNTANIQKIKKHRYLA